ncbi:hypothetical protein Daura_29575 [Dactylosporangium aurantiacum]|uniref:Uncharacterized protein n=1 Tax=Dactylosporangium aurantiacum TaxID=35754 RepID=A0A9Q9ICK4_9ACTN|nr:hypothetical protein [Dactylosporangium aurantiacum]MDG6106804.1 hypothetical protein [Dactylosporangium aurantiacum]UWZ50944.1 hypothetical protein Daura_29575 [Dactylosporangium aurantiacum]
MSGEDTEPWPAPLGVALSPQVVQAGRHARSIDVHLGQVIVGEPRHELRILNHLDLGESCAAQRPIAA